MNERLSVIMNFTPNRKNVALEKLKKASYDHDLQLYREVPDININLDEFEEWAVERLKGKTKYLYIIKIILFLLELTILIYV